MKVTKWLRQCSLPKEQLSLVALLKKVPPAELTNSVEEKKRHIFDEVIRKKLRDSMYMPPKPSPDSVEPYVDNNNETGISPLPDDNDPISSPGQAMYQKHITDCLIHAELYLLQGEDMKAAKLLVVPKMKIEISLVLMIMALC